MPVYAEFETPDNLVVVWVCEDCAKEVPMPWSKGVNLRKGRIRLGELGFMNEQGKKPTLEIRGMPALQRPPGWPEAEELIAQGAPAGKTVCEDCAPKL